MTDNQAGPAVTSFGATGDGTADDTAAVQAAIDSLAATGGTVHFPPGRYRVTALDVPVGVSLQGTYTFKSTALGSWLYCVGAEAPALTLRGGNSVRELAFFYPEQGWDEAGECPARAYPASIFLAEGANRVLVRDVFFANTYEAIDANRHHEYLVLNNVQGYAIHRGVIEDFSSDIDRWTTVHFNMNCLWEVMDPADPVVGRLAAWTRRHGTAFTVRRADWIVMFDCFCWGYRTGLKLEESEVGHGAPGGVHVIACGFDACGACIHMTSGWGVRVTDSFFVAMNAFAPGDDTAEAAVVVEGGSDFVLKNCRWWGCERGAAALGCSSSVVEGNGFNDYGRHGGDSAAVVLRHGVHQVSGNQFSGLRVYLAQAPGERNPGCRGLALLEGVEAATVSGNLFTDLEGGSIASALPPERLLLSGNIHRGTDPGVPAAADLVLPR